jgi:hypothetical protein
MAYTIVSFYYGYITKNKFLTYLSFFIHATNCIFAQYQVINIGYTFMKGLLSIFCIFIVTQMFAQRGGLGGNMQQFAGRFGGGGGSNAGGTDSLEKRDKFEDSIIISYKYFNDPKVYKRDTAIDDFFSKIPFPASYRNLGNFGNAAQSLIWNPMVQSGFDAGFHAFDVYRLTLDNTQLFQTSKPFTEIDYVVGSNLEQYVNVLHTQNIKPNINISAQYRLINSLGAFKNAQSNINNYRLAINYASKRKRYNAQFAFVGNKLQSAENGGIRSGIDYKNDETYIDRRNIPVRIGDSLAGGRNIFSTALRAGNKYAEGNVVYRHSYDIGKRDSIVTDSINYEVFYPKLRLQHTFSIQNNRYLFIDGDVDSVYYKDLYNIDVKRRINNGGFYFRDRFKIIENDVSLYQFPDKRNTQQFIQAGINLQQINFQTDSSLQYVSTIYEAKDRFTNTHVYGRYRNITRNKKWDMDAYANLYVTGRNIGDYKWSLKLKSLVSRKLGSFEIFVENANQTPAYIFSNNSAFTRGVNDDYNKQNILHGSFSFDNAPLKLSAAAHLYAVTNFTYYSNFKQTAQSGVFNVFQAIVDKKVSLSKRWHLYTQWALQQRIGNADLELPLLFTRNRIVYEKRIKKLLLNTGLELKYFTPYKVQQYSPVGGQFIWSANTETIVNLPDIAAYLNFKIRGFSAYIRAENLNAARINTNNGFNFNFTNNNQFNQEYLMPGLHIRIGVFWEFLN